MNDDLTIHADRAARSVLTTLDAFGPTAPAGLVAAFFAIALNEGKSLREIARLTGMPQSTISRHSLTLGKWARPGRRGLDLVQARTNPMERRAKIYTLTPKGRRVLNDLAIGAGGGQREER